MKQVKNTVITLTLILGCVVLGKAQTTIDDYKYVVVPHFFEFVKGKDVYRLNTITRYLLRKNGFRAYMEEEIKESDYKSNNCLALKANVISINSMLKTKLKILLKNCDGEIIFESKEGESKAKTYEIAYKAALNQAFESFEDINYKYKPNSNILSRADKNEAEEKVIEAENEVKKLKAEIQELKEDKKTTKKVKEKDRKELFPEARMEVEEFLEARPKNNGFELINSLSKKVDFVLIKSGINNVFIIKNKNGIVYRKGTEWLREYLDGDKSVIEVLEIKF